MYTKLDRLLPGMRSMRRHGVVLPILVSLVTLQLSSSCNRNSAQLASKTYTCKSDEGGQLDWKHCSLTTFSYSFIGCQQITKLDLSGTCTGDCEESDTNKIASINGQSFDGLTGLTELYLDHNALKSISAGDFLSRGLARLSTLDLSWNVLTSISPNSFQYMRGLNTLYLYNNVLSVLTNTTFTDLPQLQTLRLENNVISIIHPGTFDGVGHSLRRLALTQNRLQILSSGAFRSLSNLATLELSRNNLELLVENIFSDMKALKRLDLSYNNIRNVGRNVWHKNWPIDTTVVKMDNNPSICNRSAKGHWECHCAWDLFAPLQRMPGGENGTCICRAGQYLPVSEPHELHTHWVDVLAMCTQCPKGRYSDTNGQERCIPCSTDYTSDVGSNTSQSCEEDPNLRIAEAENRVLEERVSRNNIIAAATAAACAAVVILVTSCCYVLYLQNQLKHVQCERLETQVQMQEKEIMFYRDWRIKPEQLMFDRHI